MEAMLNVKGKEIRRKNPVISFFLFFYLEMFGSFERKAGKNRDSQVARVLERGES